MEGPLQGLGSNWWPCRHLGLSRWEVWVFSASQLHQGWAQREEWVKILAMMW